MKKFARFTAVAALALGFAAGDVMADKPVEGVAHTHDNPGPFTLKDLCTAGDLDADTKIQRTTESFGDDCIIDLNGFDLAIHRATIEVTAGDDGTDIVGDFVTPGTKFDVIDGLVDVNDDGDITTADDGTKIVGDFTPGTKFDVIDGFVDVNDDSAITMADDGTDIVGDFTPGTKFDVIDGFVDANGDGFINLNVGDLTIKDDTDGGGLVAIIASDITVAGSLTIGLGGITTISDVTVTRNIEIAVGTDLTIDTTGSVNVRDNWLTSGGSMLTITGDAGVSIKDNVLTGFDFVNIGSSGGEVFVNGNDFGGAIVTLTAVGGDCKWTDNINPPASQCPP